VSPAEITLAKREVDFKAVAHLVPKLLQSIKDASGLHYEELYRRLAVPMGLGPASLKRNWLRWKAVSAEVDKRGRLAQSVSLSRLIAATPQEWLANAEHEGYAPLLALLDARHERLRLSNERAALKEQSHLQRYLRSTIEQGKVGGFDDVTWIRTIYRVMDGEVTRELRRRLLGSGRGPAAAAHLREELLSGTVSETVKAALAAATPELSALHAEIEQRERMERAEFEQMREDGA